MSECYLVVYGSPSNVYNVKVDHSQIGSQIRALGPLDAPPGCDTVAMKANYIAFGRDKLITIMDIDNRNSNFIA